MEVTVPWPVQTDVDGKIRMARLKEGGFCGGQASQRGTREPRRGGPRGQMTTAVPPAMRRERRKERGLTCPGPWVSAGTRSAQAVGEAGARRPRPARCWRGEGPWPHSLGHEPPAAEVGVQGEDCSCRVQHRFTLRGPGGLGVLHPAAGSLGTAGNEAPREPWTSASEPGPWSEGGDSPAASPRESPIAGTPTQPSSLGAQLWAWPCGPGR